MGIIGVILLAIALGIDCAVASFSQGLILKSSRMQNSLKLAIVMGLFQGLMPIIGYVAALKVYDIIVPYSKIFVCSIFLILGLHFIVESFKSDFDNDNVQCIDLKCLMGLGIATSVDALISGVTIKLTHTCLISSCLIIGVISFIMSEIGFWLGNFVKCFPARVLNIIGGLILVLLALKSIF